MLVIKCRRWPCISGVFIGEMVEVDGNCIESSVVEFKN